MIIKMRRTISLETKVIYLTKCIKSAVKLFVSKQRICAKSKSWWNGELIEMRKALSSRKRIWKRYRTDDAWTEIMRMRNSYYDAIKLVKNQFWTNFLNKVKEKKVFQTYKFIKSRLIEKLFSIQNAQKKLKTEFNEKCETFLKAMYSSSSKVQINENLLSNESIQWSRIIEREIKHAINSSALRKALESEFFLFFYFFIKCMQPMAMALSRRCMYAKLHVTWPKLLLYIFSLINHIDSLRIQALSLKPSSSYFRFPLSLRTLRVLLFRF